MEMKKACILLIILCSVLFKGWAQQETSEEKTTPKLKEYVVVTASPSPSIKSETARSVLILTSEEISKLPVTSVAELLKYVIGFDFQQRGAGGMQVDASLRGGTFEQTLILIDGFKINDPQTGHNSLNVPLTIEDVERIEVLRGPGSRLFGPNAFSGVVNIVTRRRGDKGFALGTKYGQHSYREVAARASSVTGRLQNSTSFSYRASSGYLDNTDFDQVNLYDRWQVDFKSGSASFHCGFSEKSFGANGFYASSFPNQWEKVRVLFTGLETNLYSRRFIINPKIYLRHGFDQFLLDRNNPSLFENIHHNQVLGSQVNSSYLSRFGETSAGLEFRAEQVNSTNLGERRRETFGVYLEHKYEWSNFALLVGMVAYKYSGLPWKAWPGVEINYHLAGRMVWFLSYNQSFRLPTFTELYYHDPVNLGHSQLKPEENKEVESGFRYAQKQLTAELSVFRRKAFNLIDWVRTSDLEPWQARNISEMIVSGTEISLAVHQELLRRTRVFEDFRVNFVYYQTNKFLPPEYISKYALSGLKEQLMLNLGFKKMYGSRCNLFVRHFRRLNGRPATVVDARISWKLNKLEITCEGTNLLNKFYYDAGFLPAPGRWLLVGVKTII
ncbi:MAG: TonB-dependent receptor plug domain-containing protein [Candidatus Saccharicenans sp.]